MIDKSSICLNLHCTTELLDRLSSRRSDPKIIISLRRRIRETWIMRTDISDKTMQLPPTSYPDIIRPIANLPIIMPLSLTLSPSLILSFFCSFIIYMTVSSHSHTFSDIRRLYLGCVYSRRTGLSSDSSVLQKKPILLPVAWPLTLVDLISALSAATGDRKCGWRDDRVVGDEWPCMWLCLVGRGWSVGR